MTMEITQAGQNAPRRDELNERQLMLLVLERLDGIESRLDALERRAGAVSVPPEAEKMLAMAVDVMDDRAAQLRAAGVDIDATLAGWSEMLKVLADPEVSAAAQRLAQRLPDLSKLVEDGPKMAALAVDVFDDLAAKASRRGLDLDAAVGSLLTVGLRLSELLDSPQFHALFESGVLAPETLEIIGRAGRALSEQSATDCGRTGVFGAIGATSDADIQRAVHFLIGVAKRFGGQMACATPALPERAN